MSRQLVVTKYVPFSGDMLAMHNDDPGWARYMQHHVAKTAGEIIADLLLDGALDQTMPVMFDVHEATEAELYQKQQEDMHFDRPVWNPYSVGDRTVEIRVTYWDKRDPDRLTALVADSKAHPAQVARRPVNELEQFKDRMLDRYQ